jgi:uncharacterized protein (TIGR02265 family)
MENLQEWENRVRHKYVMIESFLKANNSLNDPRVVERLEARTELNTKRPAQYYSRRTTLQIMDVLCEYYYPNLSKADAYYKLGYDSFNGFRQTISGRVTWAMLKLKILQPKRIFKNAVESINEQDENATRVLIQDSPTTYRLQFRDDPLDPYAMHGVIQCLLDSTPLKDAKAELRQLSYLNFDLVCTWRE